MLNVYDGVVCAFGALLKINGYKGLLMLLNSEHILIYGIKLFQPCKHVYINNIFFIDKQFHEKSFLNHRL